MAHGRPWYKRAGGDFVMATMAMPDAETKWAYSAIVDILNDRDRPLPDDPGFICGFTGLSKRRWAVVRDYLVAHGYLVPTPDGQLTNPRFERERAERAAAHQKSVEGGREGGKRSAAARAAQPELELGDGQTAQKNPEKVEKNSPKNHSKSKDKSEVPANGSPDFNHLTQPLPQGTRAGVRGESLEDREEAVITTNLLTSARAIDPFDLADHLTRIAGVRNVEPNRIIANVAIVREWLALGADMVEIEQTIMDIRDRDRSPIHSLKYFDQPIRKQTARKAYPNAKPRHDISQIRDPLLRRYLEGGGSLGT
jgi:uncharacterized protein YdaU (DUF1376 family)